MTAKPQSRFLKHYYARRQRGDHLRRIWTTPDTHRLLAEILAENGMTAEQSFAAMVRNEAQRLGVV